MLKILRNFIKEDNKYFALSKKEIIVQNHQMLINGSIIYAGILLFYTIFTIETNQPNILKNMYYIFDLIHICFCACTFKLSKRSKNNYILTQCLCVFMELSVLGFFVLEAVFTSKTQHSLYVPIAIILVILLFIHRTAYTMLLTTVYVVSYAVLSVLFKTPEAYINDIYIAIATFLATCIGYMLIAKTRHSEGAALYRFEKLSKTDSLTGLLNKTTIEDICKEAIANPDHTCAFIILDLDNFKSINDAYGHDVGDKVLSAVGPTIKKCFRSNDFVGRFGGDEFIVLMDNCNEIEVIEQTIKKALSKISELRFEQSKIKIKCSAGITLKNNNDDFSSIFKRADNALYESKVNKKGSYKIKNK